MSSLDSHDTTPRRAHANIGNNIALEMMEKAEQKQQAQKKDTSLPDKLTNKERMN